MTKKVLLLMFVSFLAFGACKKEVKETVEKEYALKGSEWSTEEGGKKTSIVFDKNTFKLSFETEEELGKTTDSKTTLFQKNNSFAGDYDYDEDKKSGKINIKSQDFDGFVIKGDGNKTETLDKDTFINPDKLKKFKEKYTNFGEELLKTLVDITKVNNKKAHIDFTIKVDGDKEILNFTFDEKENILLKKK